MLKLNICRIYELGTVFDDDFDRVFEKIIFQVPYNYFFPNFKHLLPHPFCTYGTIMIV